MEIKNYINAFASILNTDILFFGYSVSLLEILLYIAFGSLVAFIIGGIFK